jgi:DNA polymerase III delta prime subunit
MGVTQRVEGGIMGDVRSRIEAAQMAERYKAREPQTKQTRDQIEQARAARLAQNAEKIRSEAVTEMLIDMDDAEREVVFTLIGRERPDALGNADVIAMTLERVRVVGTKTLREVLIGTTKAERDEVWNILCEGTAEQKLGMDGAVACREALRQVRHRHFEED